jgi:Patatin-like phospholipase
MTSKKLAVVISGAVSLGSYEAGVMYEILEAIAIHNNKQAEDKIEIDIITGASAGGMTACILAQHLLCGDQAAKGYENQSLRKAYDNPLYNAWVKSVDIENLIDVEPSDQKFSLLKTSVVDEIGEKFLSQEITLSQKHPSVADNIYVGIAMSNLNGYGYGVDTIQAESQGQFTYTRYKDQFICNIARRESLGTCVEEFDFKPVGNKKII